MDRKIQFTLISLFALSLVVIGYSNGVDPMDSGSPARDGEADERGTAANNGHGLGPSFWELAKLFEPPVRKRNLFFKPKPWPIQPATSTRYMPRAAAVSNVTSTSTSTTPSPATSRQAFRIPPRKHRHSKKHARRIQYSSSTTANPTTKRHSTLVSTTTLVPTLIRALKSTTENMRKSDSIELTTVSSVFGSGKISELPERG